MALCIKCRLYGLHIVNRTRHLRQSVEICLCEMYARDETVKLA
jgi:hypothetical protein